jgi:ankyrin repeat protein
MKAGLAIAGSVLVLTWSRLAFGDDIQNFIIWDDLAKVKELLKANPGLVNRKDSDGWTPLHYAIAYNQKDIIELLVADGAEPSIQEAAAIGDPARVKALLTANLDLINGQDADGCTALHYAIQYGHKNIVKLLLAANADVNGRQGSDSTAWLGRQGASNTPLLDAAWGDDEDIAELLLAKNAEVNGTDDDGLTALHVAALNGETDLMKLLLANNADVSARANDGETPLHEASEGGYKHAVKLLLANRADVNARADDGTTPLEDAAAGGHEDVVKLLLADGADTNAKDDKGNTPLNRAIIEGQTKVVNFLRRDGAKAATLPYSRHSLQASYISTADVQAVLDSIEKAYLNDDAAAVVANYASNAVIGSDSPSGTTSYDNLAAYKSSMELEFIAYNIISFRSKIVSISIAPNGKTAQCAVDETAEYICEEAWHHDKKETDVIRESISFAIINDQLLITKDHSEVKTTE